MSTQSLVEVIVPENETAWKHLRTKDVTSTEVPALFDCSPYLTDFELHHRKAKGEIVEIESNDRMFWGQQLQDGIAGGIRVQQGWDVRPMREYMRLPDFRLGASFDYTIGGDGLLEIKLVDGLQFKEGWIVDGDNVEAPPHIELQVQTQLAVSGRSFCYIGALVGGNRLVLIKREPDTKVIKAILSKVETFWQNVEANTPPTPDFAKAAGFIAQLYAQSTAGKVLDAKGDTTLSALVKKYQEHGADEREAKALKDAAKAQLLMAIGDHEKVFGDGFTISAGTVKATRVEAFDRSAYRNFRVFEKAAK